jgi:hypothetical protein
MAAPDPFPGEGGPGAPEAGRSGLACDGPVITRGGPGPPGEAGCARATRELSRPPGCAETPGLMELGGGSGDRGPSCQARRPYAMWPRGEEEYGLWEAEGLDTLAGGTPICMYRHSPYRINLF